MAQLETTYREERRIPINRNNMFYSEADFMFETEIGKNYLEEDVNQTVILYQVDLEKTNLDSVYNESKKDAIVYKPPVELHCLYEIEESALQSYDKTKNLGTYIKSGKLKFGLFQSTLDEVNAEINVGDYVGVVVSDSHIEYYVVTDCGRNNFDNAKTTFGYKSAWRNIECAPISSENEFRGI